MVVVALLIEQIKIFTRQSSQSQGVFIIEQVEGGDVMSELLTRTKPPGGPWQRAHLGRRRKEASLLAGLCHLLGSESKTEYCNDEYVCNGLEYFCNSTGLQPQNEDLATRVRKARFCVAVVVKTICGRQLAPNEPRSLRNLISAAIISSETPSSGVYTATAPVERLHRA